MNILKLIALYSKVMSPIHDTQAAYDDAKAKGLNPIAQPAVINNAVIVISIVLAAVGYNIPGDKLLGIDTALYQLINGGIAAYGIIMWVSKTYFSGTVPPPTAPTGQA